MARSFTASEAKKLIRDLEELKKGLGKTVRAPLVYREKVSLDAERLLKKEILTVLSGVPVEELNREKRGFRVKALREAGIENLAKVYETEVYELAAVNGISRETAYDLKAAVNVLVKDAQGKIRVSLSSDDRNAEATALITSLSRLERAKAQADLAESLLSAYEKRITDAAAAVSGAESGLKWFFLGRKEKDRAEGAFSELAGFLTGSFGRDARNILRNTEAIANLSGEAAWEDFTKNSIRMINSLEEISPGILGSDETILGLPEEFVDEIREEPILTTGLRCELRNYQVLGVKYALHQKRVLLGDEMGLGKTVQAIAVMVSLRNAGATHFAVVCPASVLSNWCREIGKMSDLPCVKVHGDDRSEAFHRWMKKGGVAVTTYETAWLFNTEPEYHLSLLTVDEAHYIKNPEAQRTAFVRNLCTRAERLLFMTGTALENRVSEMISLIEVLNPEIAKKIRGMEYLSQAPEFREIVAPVYYRRKREDVLTELPELIDTKEWCELSREETKAYNRAVLSKNYADIRRVSWNVPDLKESSKAKRMLEIIGDAEEDGRKVIVFSFFLDTIAKVKALLGEQCMTPINGSVPPAKRQEIIDEFEKAPAGTVLVAQIQSGGTGLNIQTASVVILCEPQFKPSVENQAISRAYRMGQTRNVLVYRLLCDDTVDEEIMTILEDKQTVFDAFADPSAAAENTASITETTWSEIVEREIARIQKEEAQGQLQTAQEQAEQEQLEQTATGAADPADSTESGSPSCS